MGVVMQTEAQKRTEILTAWRAYRAGGRIFDVAEGSVVCGAEEGAVAACFRVYYATLFGAPDMANALAVATLTSPTLGERAIASGDEIMVFAKGFVDVSFLQALGLTPVMLGLTDLSGDAFEMALENALSMQTKAVFVAHGADGVVDLKTVRNFCNKYDLWLIEDSQNATGACYDFDGTVYCTGAIGDVGTVRLETPAGSVGAVLTNNDTLCAISCDLCDTAKAILDLAPSSAQMQGVSHALPHIPLQGGN